MEAFPLWRSRLLFLAGGIGVGLAAVVMAKGADLAQEGFKALTAPSPLIALVLTPAGFALAALLARTVFPNSQGSGIPQVIAARHARDDAFRRGLISLRVGIGKVLVLFLGLLCGASAGREGPTVQVAAAVMGVTHRALRVPLNAAVIVAGGAAGVAAAFNTPLAGVLFAIEELAAAYEQKVTLLVLSLIVVAGITAQALMGDYIYFGAIGAHMSLATAVLVVPVAGVMGGAFGGLFSRVMLGLASGAHRITALTKASPIVFAGVCGLIVAGLGIATSGLTWGAGYSAARAMIVGVDAPLWFGPAKALATLATAVAGLPGGIFAPSLAVGAGVGNLLHAMFPGDPAGAVVILGMTAYFAGVVRAPLTAVIILSETTASRGLLLPMFAVAFIADWASRAVCREKLYHGLAETFR